MQGDIQRAHIAALATVVRIASEVVLAREFVFTAGGATGLTGHVTSRDGRCSRSHASDRLDILPVGVLFEHRVAVVTAGAARCLGREGCFATVGQS